MKKTNIILLAAVSAAAAITLSGCVAAVGAGVAAGAVGIMASDSRTVGTVIDDSAIEAKAIDRLDKYSHAKFRESSIGTTSIKNRESGEASSSGASIIILIIGEDIESLTF